MEALGTFVMSYFMLVAACLVIPVLLAVLVPPLGGPMVSGVLWLFFVAPVRLAIWLRQRGTANREETEADADRRADEEVDRVNAPPGWYADPRSEARMRWWDGIEWTDHTK